MKIATWNVARPTRERRIEAVIAACTQIHADILVLTEADERIQLPDYPYRCASKPPQGHILPPCSAPVSYAPTERRMILYAKYPMIQKIPTYDEATAICVRLQTERGDLTVYGSIIGIYGHRQPFFTNDLQGQMGDIKKLTSEGHRICFLGDYNCSFADNYYSAGVGRDEILTCFSDMGISLLTQNQPECIDHIAVSDSFLTGTSLAVEEWNSDQSISDHKGIAVEIETTF